MVQLRRTRIRWHSFRTAAAQSDATAALVLLRVVCRVELVIVKHGWGFFRVMVYIG